jgi:hypothetical protein
MATITSTTKIDSIMKKVFSSLTDPRGRIKKDTTKNIIFCIIYTTSLYGSIWDLLATYDNISFENYALISPRARYPKKIKEQDREY